MSYSDIIYPECENEGDFVIDYNCDVFCIHCGLVIESPYPYVAGCKFKCLDEILIEKENEERRKEYKKF